MTDLDYEALYWENKLAAAERLENPEAYDEQPDEEFDEDEYPVEYDDEADAVWDGRFDYDE